MARMICKCDRCEKEGIMQTPNRLEKGWDRHEGFDLCRECCLEWKKIHRKAIRELMLKIVNKKESRKVYKD